MSSNAGSTANLRALQKKQYVELFEKNACLPINGEGWYVSQLPKMFATQLALGSSCVARTRLC